jgi:hypothetical protein
MHPINFPWNFENLKNFFGYFALGASGPIGTDSLHKVDRTGK